MRKRILIIDDSEIDREILSCILSIDDYDIDTAENGYLGLEKILRARRPIDCIILDLHMPIMNGFSVLEIMKQNEVKNIPVVIMTAESTSENLKKTFPYNIADFICKPYEPELILMRLKKILEDR